ncbi:ERBB-3 BINDING PROTEIN 1-like [Alnus glutinosa]|uniref:ERBB-3 BINDING PROTEIN 1-like n=1 Tax=Alnus glutinosa TaxID=3517 RepID=UPI002D7774EA|nr:ERBB-3 BINDING PROTEIN 1-like [Alnus glutinosa]
MDTIQSTSMMRKFGFFLLLESILIPKDSDNACLSSSEIGCCASRVLTGTEDCILLVHLMDMKATAEILCMQCLKIQPVGPNKDVTDAIQKVAAAYDCKIVEGVLRHQLKQFVIDGNKVVLSVSDPETRVEDAEFEENEVYAVDIVTSTSEGKFMWSFSTSGLLEDKRGRLGLVECVLHEKLGDNVAHIKFTVLLMPNGSDRVTSHPLQELQPTKTIDQPEIKAWFR